jgi:hypothetical protein
MPFYARLGFVYCSYEFVVVELTSSAEVALHGDAELLTTPTYLLKTTGLQDMK